MEVTLAIGLVSFSMLAVLGLLPVGLNSVRESVAYLGEAGIARQLRTEIEQMPLSAAVGGSATNAVGSLGSATYYYDQQGNRLSSSTGAYFAATFAVSDPAVPGAGDGFTNCAKTVKVTLRYPQGVSASSQQSKVFSFLAVGQ